MPLAAGTRLGPYEVLGLIGAGGMGEVYRARDPRLNRTVAVKVLPAAISTDPDRLARFQREAEAVAALNHPNIVTIHSVEEHGGVRLLTMELIEGQSLDQVTVPGGLPLAQVLDIGIALADALAASHEKGIIHRDLKPANIMLAGRERRVKVLDFGLAKLRNETAVDGETHTDTSTGDGRIVGTVAYMSPEQAEGKPVDKRSDLFSLGVVLYEMATGERPFKGDTNLSMLSAILRDTPTSATDLRADMPREFGRILKRALNKDAEHRYQTAKDLRNDLEMLKQDLESGNVLPMPSHPLIGQSRRRWAQAVVLLAVVAAAVGTWWAFGGFAFDRQALEAERFFDDFTVTRLTTENTSPRAVAISVDGKYVAYVSIENGREGVRVRQADTSGSVQVVPPGDVEYDDLAFSPDVNRLYYLAYPKDTGEGTLYEVPVLGGPARRVLDNVDSAPSFSPDATRFAIIRDSPGKSTSIVVANVDGTGEQALVTRESPNHFVLVKVAWSDDGRRMAAAVRDGRGTAIVTVDTTTGVVQPLGQQRWDAVTSIAWPRNESFLIVSAVDFLSADTYQLWQVSIPTGSVRRVTKDVAAYRRVSITADGRTLVTVRSEWHGTLWIARTAQLERPVRIASVPDTVAPSPIRWTTDGRILYTATVGGNYDIWTVRADGSDLRQLTTSPGHDTSPTITRDNRYISFVSDRDGSVRIWRMDPDGGRQTRLTNGRHDEYPVASGDSRSVIFVNTDQPGTPMYVVPIEGGQPTPLPRPSSLVPLLFRPYEVSPDGSLTLGSFYDDQERRQRVVLVPTDGEGEIRKLDITVPFDVGVSYAWGPDGRSVTFTKTIDGATNLWRQPLEDATATQLTNFSAGENVVVHSWSRDGKFLALVRGSRDARVVLMRARASHR